MIKYIKAAIYRLDLHKYLAKRRLRVISELVENKLDQGEKLKVLEVGCHNGRDFIHFLKGKENIQITGLDIEDYGIEQENFEYCGSDAEAIPFPDKYFDIVVSIGVLEHITPIEKLCRVISEIDRVSNQFVMIVPSVNTLIEPHTASVLWQLRSVRHKESYPGLNFFSDEAWLSFSGFKRAKTKRFWLIPFILGNLCIYSKTE